VINMRFCHRRSLGWVTSLGLWGCGWWLAAGLLVNGEGARAIAADHIRVGLSILELSLPVEALEEFAATGQVTRSLRPFVRGLDQQDLAYLRLSLTPWRCRNYPMDTWGKSFYKVWVGWCKRKLGKMVSWRCALR